MAKKAILKLFKKVTPVAIDKQVASTRHKTCRAMSIKQREELDSNSHLRDPKVESYPLRTGRCRPLEPCELRASATQNRSLQFQAKVRRPRRTRVRRVR